MEDFFPFSPDLDIGDMPDRQYILNIRNYESVSWCLQKRQEIKYIFGPTNIEKKNMPYLVIRGRVRIKNKLQVEKKQQSFV